MNKKYLSIITVVTYFLSCYFAYNTAAQTANTISIDFTNTIRQVSPLAFSMDISGYGRGSYITNDQTHKKRLTDLKLGMTRMHLYYMTSGDPTSPIICHGSGCDTKVSGDSWVTAMKGLGAEPVLIITVSGTHSTDQDKVDAVNLVKHFNKDTNNPVKRWIIGNELDNSGNADHMDATTYSNRFNVLFDAMKSVDPTIKIGGPATAYYDTSYIDTFLTISGSKTDFIDFHTYGQGGTENKSEATLLAETVKYTNDLNDLRNRIQQKVPSRVNAIEMQIGEWNLDWNSDPKLYTHFNTVWAASVLGRIIQSGGYAMQYADKNGSLGSLYEVNTNGGVIDDPMPVYHAYGMFTGEGLFSKFGTSLVQTTTQIPSVEVYASDNPKMIVVINKNSTNSIQATISLTGVTTGTAVVWRKDGTMSPIAPPKNVEIIQVNNSAITYTFPQYSVTTLLLNTTNFPTPTGQTTNTALQLSILLHGIGKGGDNVNPQGSGNMNPLHTQQSVNIDFFNTNNQLVVSKSGTVTFNAVEGNFTGNILLENIPSGVYTARIAISHYLRKTIPGIISITSGQNVPLPVLSLTTGDTNNDNTLSILDYNILLDCFSDLSPARNCSDPNKKLASDLTDDGSVNQFDYNLFLRELSVQSGQ
jgi:hypothetical protein